MRRFRGRSTYIHPLIKQVVDEVLARTRDNAINDRELAFGENAWRTCDILGVPHDAMREAHYGQADGEHGQDDDKLLHRQAHIAGGRDTANDDECEDANGNRELT